MAIKVYTYTDDTGETISVRMDEAKATVGGFQNASSTSGILGATPNHRLRGIYARNAAGSVKFFPMATQDEARYASKTQVNFSYNGSQYTSVSSRGEKRLHGNEGSQIGQE